LAQCVQEQPRHKMPASAPSPAISRCGSGQAMTDERACGMHINSMLGRLFAYGHRQRHWDCNSLVEES
jgi:hypothetical protein